MKAQASVARAIADLDRGTILASIDIAAPAERVYAALTRPEEITRWWGSDEVYRTTEWVSELRVGGLWRATGVGADGKPFSVRGEYLALDPPHKIVHTWQPDWDEGHTTTVTYVLSPSERGTRLTVRHDGFEGRRESCQDHSTGWEMVITWLANHAAPEKRAPQLYFLLRLLPPRPTFPMDMTPAEAQVMQNHVGYWQGQLHAGRAVVFGPVLDPKGAWGLGVVAVQSEDEARLFEREDPAIASGLGFKYEILPMPQTIARP